MFSKTKQFILPLVGLLFILIPIRASAYWECSCATFGTPVQTYDTQSQCNSACSAYCEPEAHGGGDDCNEIGGGGGEGNGGGQETEGGGHEVSPGYQSAKLDNPLAGNETSIPNLIARVIKIVLGLIGVVSLIMFIYAGFLWLTAQGNMEKVKTGRDTMLYAVIGIVVVFSSYIILNYLFGILTF